MPSSSPQILNIERLTVEFSSGKSNVHRALDSVTLSIAEGEVLGLVGESGSGKTVLSHSILGLLPANGHITAGRIFWQGSELQSFPEHKLRSIRGKEIAMIFQDPQASLNPVYSVGQQVEWILKLHRQMVGTPAKAEVLRLFESVKLRDPERCFGSYPHELSGGMCQRVMIAMALACRPKLLIADEPTSALDMSISAEIVALLGRIRDEYGLSILIITHDLNVATRISDRIAVLDHGQVVETVASRSFMTNASNAASQRLIQAIQFLGGTSSKPSLDYNCDKLAAGLSS